MRIDSGVLTGWCKGTRSPGCRLTISLDDRAMGLNATVTGTGTNGVYTLKGFAAFVVTGYSLPGFNAASWLTGITPCSGSDKCLSGFFTHGLIPSGATIGGTADLSAPKLSARTEWSATR